MKRYKQCAACAFALSSFAFSAYCAEISTNLTSGEEVAWSTTSIWEIDGTSAGRLPAAGDTVVITTTDDGSGAYATVNAVAGNNVWGIDGSLTLNGPTHLKFSGSNMNPWGSITLNSGSILEVNTNSWSNFRLMMTAGATANFTVEKGASFILNGAHFSPNSTHNLSSDSVANVDIKGEFMVTSGAFFLAEGTRSTSNLNIYGSASVFSENGITYGNNYVGNTTNMTFKMQDVRLDSIAGQSDAISALLVTSSLTYSNNSTVNYIIDFADFSIDGGSFVEGQTYNFALMSVDSGLDETILDKFSIANEDGLGGEWALAGASKEDYLTISDNTLYLNLSRVPEPSTYAAILGLAALALAARRKRG